MMSSSSSSTKVVGSSVIVCRKLGKAGRAVGGRKGGRSIPPSASGRGRRSRRGSLRFFPRLRVRSDFMRHECLAGLLPSSHGVRGDRKKGPK